MKVELEEVRTPDVIVTLTAKEAVKLYESLGEYVEWQNVASDSILPRLQDALEDVIHA